MRPELEEIESRFVLGIVTRIDPRTADYRRLWKEGFDPHRSEVAAVAAEPDYYAVYYSSGEDGKADFLTGMLVRESTAVPAGLERRLLPGGRFARFDCTLATIGKTWDEIYERWLPESGFREDPRRAPFEVFVHGAEGPQAPVAIHVPFTTTE